VNTYPVYVLDDFDDGLCLVASDSLQAVMDYAGHAAIQWQYEDRITGWVWIGRCRDTGISLYRIREALKL